MAAELIRVSTELIRGIIMPKNKTSNSTEVASLKSNTLQKDTDECGRQQIDFDISDYAAGNGSGQCRMHQVIGCGTGRDN